MGVPADCVLPAPHLLLGLRSSSFCLISCRALRTMGQGPTVHNRAIGPPPPNFQPIPQTLTQ